MYNDRDLYESRRPSGRIRGEHEFGNEGLRGKIRAMIEKAEADYQDAAAMHFMGKVSHAGGRIAALKEVLKIL